MKSCLVLAALCVGLLAFGAAPVVENVAIVQDADTREVCVTYDLLGSPAVVSLSVRVNGKAVGGTALSSAVGDVNRLVSTGAVKKISWRPDKTWTGDPTDTVVSLVVTSPSEAPDYLVVDLSPDFMGELAYYPNAESLPDGGLANDLYRTDRLVLRRIPAANVEWLMGSPQTEASRGSSEVQHRVRLTRDYWMAVFETTQAQYERLMGRNPSLYTGSTRPVDQAYIWIRDQGTTTDNEKSTAEAFRLSEPHAESFLGILRAKTGLDFDLPTEAEWEYACRAGTTVAYNNRTDKEEASLFGKYYMDGDAKDPAGTSDPTVASVRVGSYPPNRWGLYDMSGNVWEWCLDAYSATNYGLGSLDGVLTDPVNLTNGDSARQRVRRGGSWRDAVTSYGRSASRYYYNNAFKSIGFRVICKGALAK